jgi:hypothetical protein
MLDQLTTGNFDPPQRSDSSPAAPASSSSKALPASSSSTRGPSTLLSGAGTAPSSSSSSDLFGNVSGKSNSSASANALSKKSKKP